MEFGILVFMQIVNYFFLFPRQFVSLFVHLHNVGGYLSRSRQNFLAALASHPELKGRLLKEFWYAGEKIYEVYEIDRPPRGTAIRHVAPLKFTDRTQKENRDWPFAINSEQGGLRNS